MIKKLSFFILIAAFSIIPHAYAANSPVVPQDYSYLFHLYYDNGTLVPDRDFQIAYDIIGAPYADQTLTTQFPYRGEIINFSGEVAAHFVFDPRGGDIHFTAGKISVQAPYVADGNKAIFYDSQNNPLLTIFVNGSSYCNDDGICNADRGEDALSCPTDCKATVPAAPPVTSSAAANAQTSNILLGVILSLGGVALIAVGWWFLRRRGRMTKNPPVPPPPTILPPSPPSSSTPPTPPNPGNPV